MVRTRSVRSVLGSSLHRLITASFIGQFRDVFPHLTLPGSLKQRLFFAGDAISASHGSVSPQPEHFIDTDLFSYADGLLGR
jgi:hypothetical protein